MEHIPLDLLCDGQDIILLQQSIDHPVLCYHINEEREVIQNATLINNSFLAYLFIEFCVLYFLCNLLPIHSLLIRIKLIRRSASEPLKFKNRLDRMSRISEQLCVLIKRKSVVVLLLSKHFYIRLLFYLQDVFTTMRSFTYNFANFIEQTTWI